MAFLAFTRIVLGLPADPAEGAPTHTKRISLYDELGRRVDDGSQGAAAYRYDTIGDILPQAGRTS